MSDQDIVYAYHSPGMDLSTLTRTDGIEQITGTDGASIAVAEAGTPAGNELKDRRTTTDEPRVAEDRWVAEAALDLGEDPDKARAEGFMAGLFMGTVVTLDLRERCPPTTDDVDVDASEIVRELEGVETPDDAVEYVKEAEDHDGATHVSGTRGATKKPYVASFVTDDSIPPGWKRQDPSSTEHGNYLVKK